MSKIKEINDMFFILVGCVDYYIEDHRACRGLFSNVNWYIINFSNFNSKQ